MWKSFKRKVAAACALSASDWLLVVRAWGLLAYFHLALKQVGFDQLQRRLALTEARNNTPSRTLAIAWRMQKLISLAARLHIFRITCLTRSCTLQWLLHRRDINSEMRIGVSRAGEEIGAHAWVEVLGEAVGEPGDIGERFPPLHA